MTSDGNVRFAQLKGQESTVVNRHIFAATIGDTSPRFHVDSFRSSIK